MRKLDLAALFPTFEPAWQKTVAWWQARSLREQWLLGILGALLAAWLLAVAVILPIQRARAAAMADIRTYENLTARLRSAGTLGAPTRVVRASGSPNAILSITASQFGMVAVVNRDPSGLRVNIADAPYDALMRWIAAVEQTSSIRVIRMRLVRRPASGFVAAELMVRA
jgi:general secretion pathway protein M